MASQLLAYFVFIFATAIAHVRCTREAEVLYAWKDALVDPNNVLESWDPRFVDPCAWFHVTCNGEGRVERLDLGNHGLQGHLVPELGSLTDLQRLEVFSKNISGSIPDEIGNLTNLVSLDLFKNQLSGPIPASLGNLKSLLFLRLNDNKLSGTVPAAVKDLLTNGNLVILNVTNNPLSGTAPSRN